jgi:alkylation response protein AidB-like acyl-CoA dehydrogenase
MDFDLNPEEQKLSQQIERLSGKEIESVLSPMAGGDDREVRRATLRCFELLGEIGYPSVGLGGNRVPLAHARESLAALAPSLYLSMETSAGIFGRLLFLHGTPRQIEELISPLKEGRLIGAVALSGVGMNLQETPFGTTVEPDGDRFLLSGSVGSLVNGPIADWIAVAGPLEDGIGFFLVPGEGEGVTMGKRCRGLGYDGLTLSTLTLEHCPVPADSVLGPFQGEEILQELRGWEDEILTGAALGVMKRSYESSLHHAKTHRSGGRLLIGYQEIGFKLAEILTLLQTSRLLASRAAWMEESGDKEARLLRHCAKVFCTESAERVSSQALQILGREGCLGANPVEQGYRDAKYLQVAGTSSEVSRMNIGDGVLAQVGGGRDFNDDRGSPWK